MELDTIGDEKTVLFLIMSDLRRVDWREHSACYEQNVSICNAL